MRHWYVGQCTAYFDIYLKIYVNLLIKFQYWSLSRLSCYIFQIVNLLVFRKDF